MEKDEVLRSKDEISFSVVDMRHDSDFVDAFFEHIYPYLSSNVWLSLCLNLNRVNRFYIGLKILFIVIILFLIMCYVFLSRFHPPVS